MVNDETFNRHKNDELEQVLNLQVSTLMKRGEDLGNGENKIDRLIGDNTNMFMFVFYPSFHLETKYIQP